MKLAIVERLMMSQLFPQKGNMMTQILMEDIVKKVRIGQDELKGIDFKVQSTSNGESAYVWNKDKETELEVNFTEVELDFLKVRVRELDKKEEITQELLSLCKKIQEVK